MPVLCRARGIACGSPRLAEPVLDIAAVSEEMTSFTERMRRMVCCFEARDGAADIASGETRAAQQKLGSDIFGENEAFAPFPGLKLPAGQQQEGISRASEMVVKRSQFQGKVVAQGHKRGVGFEIFEAFRGIVAQAFAELILFIEDAGIRGGC